MVLPAWLEHLPHPVTWPAFRLPRRSARRLSPARLPAAAGVPTAGLPSSGVQLVFNVFDSQLPKGCYFSFITVIEHIVWSFFCDLQAEKQILTSLTCAAVCYRVATHPSSSPFSPRREAAVAAWRPGETRCCASFNLIT